MLEQVAVKCRALGGEAFSVVTDVVDSAAVQRLADAALATFGGIDVWINNAGSGVIGRFTDAKIELHRKTIEVSLIGTLNGAHAALGVFGATQRGILINMASAGGWTPLPLGVAYTAAKFGIRGLSAALRAEYIDRPEIRICAVFPFLIDTPGLLHAANVTGRAINPGPYLYSAEQVASTLVAVARRPRDEVGVGWMARAGQVVYTIARAPTEALIGAAMLGAISRADTAPTTDGTLLTPIEASDRTDGGWLRRKHVPAAETVDRAILFGALVITLVLLGRRQRRETDERDMPIRRANSSRSRRAQPDGTRAAR